VISRARAVLALACGAHCLHDGFADILYVFLPLWVRDFGLSLAQAGLIRTVYSGGMALFQVPAGLLAERLGERRVLVTGTAVTALGFVIAAFVGGYLPLLAVLLAAGLGSGVQHPLSSSLVAQAFESGRRRAALGTYNFAGDVGKVTAAASVALLAALVGWRSAGAATGVMGFVAAIVMAVILSRLGVGGAAPRKTIAETRVEWGIRDGRGFLALSSIGIIDNATRTGFLTLAPFVLMAKGLTVAGVGGALALVFAGGAMGKFVCGLVAERLGVTRAVVLTEMLTAVGIVTVVAAPLPAALAVLLPLGIALNGTSSVLYATVADLVAPARRSRAYGLYYTVSIGGSALAPAICGAVSDTAGVPTTLGVVAAVVLVTVPLCLALRGAVAAPASA
jgi:MFS transporter, FSR family, fosmidomycin resistance protein